MKKLIQNAGIPRRAVLGASAALAVGTPAAAQTGEGKLEKAPLANSAGERRVLEVITAIDRSERAGNWIVPREDGRLLRILAASLNAKQVVELGTSVGYSGLWFSLALAKTGGHLTTYDIDPHRQSMARKNFERAGVTQLITPVLGDAHVEAPKRQEPIDLLFIDADKPGYPDYLEKLGPLVRAGGLIVAHNMHSPPPDPGYVKAVTTNPAFDTVFLNMEDQGVGVTLKKR